jgi:hypothetical protein
MELGYHPLGLNYGYLIDKAPQNVLEELGQQINILQSDFNKGEKANKYLAGELQHEYLLTIESKTKQYIKNLAQRFENESQYIVSNYKSILTLKFDELWVNFQKKYEYNPIHSHSGIYSFVIWYQIPFTFENETKYYYKSAEQKLHHGKFAFVTPNIFNRNYNIDQRDLGIDKSKEGYVAIFPSTLDHLVYPFYSSDEYRITVAGNVRNINDRYN